MNLSAVVKGNVFKAFFQFQTHSNRIRSGHLSKKFHGSDTNARLIVDKTLAKKTQERIVQSRFQHFTCGGDVHKTPHKSNVSLSWFRSTVRATIG